MTKKLYIGNLPPNCDKVQLEVLMKKFGTIEECDIISNKNYGFVHMDSETEAQEAVTQLDSTDFMGSIIKVQFSTTDVHKAPGVGSKGECFRCGSKGHLSRDCDRNGDRGRGGRGRGRGGGGSFRGYGGPRDLGGRRYGPPPPRREMPQHAGGYRDDPYEEDDVYSRGRDRDTYSMRRPITRDFEYEKRYLDEAYRRLGLSPRSYELLYRSRSRSPIGRRPPPSDYRSDTMYDSSDRSSYYDRMYNSRPERESYFDES